MREEAKLSGRPGPSHSGCLEHLGSLLFYISSVRETRYAALTLAQEEMYFCKILITSENCHVLPLVTSRSLFLSEPLIYVV